MEKKKTRPATTSSPLLFEFWPFKNKANNHFKAINHIDLGAGECPEVSTKFLKTREFDSFLENIHPSIKRTSGKEFAKEPIWS